MKKQIVSVSLIQNAKVVAALYFVISIPFVALMLLAMPTAEGPSGILFMLGVLPLLYTACGFVFTLFGAWVYNLIAARVGGFEFTTADTGRE